MTFFFRIAPLLFDRIRIEWKILIHVWKQSLRCMNENRKGVQEAQID